MARKATSRKPASAPKPAPRPSPAAAAAQQGLFQLTFARHAHGYGFVGAVAFLLNAILLLSLAGQTPPLPPGVELDFVLWLLPAVAGGRAPRDAGRPTRGAHTRPHRAG